MIDHLALQCADVDAALAFYLTIGEPLGVREIMRYQREEGPVVGLGGADGFPHLWLGPCDDRGHRPVHLALTAPDREAVDEVHRLAASLDVEVLHAPRVWPDYHEAYYGVFLRDPDGNNVEAVCHRPA